MSGPRRTRSSPHGHVAGIRSSRRGRSRRLPAGRPRWSLPAAASGWFWARDNPADGSRAADARRGGTIRRGDGIPRVEVIRPRAGGIERMTVQPGSVHAFESVDLYAMVSGYLKTQDVDIGSRVKKGQVLAEIDVPREAQAVAEAAPCSTRPRPRPARRPPGSRRRRPTGRPPPRRVAQTEADIDRLVANRRLAEKPVRPDQGPRTSGRRSRGSSSTSSSATCEAAVAAERTARLAVQTAKAQLGGGGRQGRAGAGRRGRGRGGGRGGRGPARQGPGRPGLRQDHRAVRRRRHAPRTSTPGPSSARPPTAASSAC